MRRTGTIVSCEFPIISVHVRVCVIHTCGACRVREVFVL